VTAALVHVFFKTIFFYGCSLQDKQNNLNKKIPAKDVVADLCIKHHQTNGFGHFIVMLSTARSSHIL